MGKACCSDQVKSGGDSAAGREGRHLGRKYGKEMIGKGDHAEQRGRSLSAVEVSLFDGSRMRKSVVTLAPQQVVLLPPGKWLHPGPTNHALGYDLAGRSQQTSHPHVRKYPFTIFWSGRERQQYISGNDNK